MIVLQLTGGVLAHVHNGVWTCSNDRVLALLKDAPMLAVGYFPNEDAKLAANALEVLGGVRLGGASNPVDTDVPSNAVH